MKLRHVVMAAGVGIAGWLALFGDKAPASQVAEPVVRAPNRVVSRTPELPTTAVHAGKVGAVADILTLLPRETLIGGAHSTADSATLFSSQNWNPPPPPPAKPIPPPPPSAPPLPFTYLGKKNEDGAWQVFLSRGDETLILREHSVIDDRYRVESIQPPTLTLTYMPLNQIQTLAIGGAE
jgi:hypothetical protein